MKERQILHLTEAYLNRDASIIENLQAAHLPMQRECKFAMPHIASDITKRDKAEILRGWERKGVLEDAFFLRIY